MSDLFESRAAIWGERQAYRFSLEITWSFGPKLICIMLNPSIADEFANDATVERMEQRARRYGCSGLVILNLFALVETNRLKMLQHPEPVGDGNDFHIRMWLKAAKANGYTVFVGWGNEGGFRDRHLEVEAMIREEGIEPVCLGTCVNGQPKHPLYIGYDQPFIPWRSVA